MSSSEDYLLGANLTELERLRFQHGVWGPVTNAFLDRLNVGKGWKCLDVGAGPGFVAMDLRERVGEAGEVSALEPSQFYLEWFRSEVRKRTWTNIKLVLGSVEEAQLPLQHFDLIFVRWVIAFVADPEKFLLVLLKSLRPRGVIAFQDYYYEGLSLFPRGGAFDEMPKAVKTYYKSVGGDPYVTGRMPAWFKKHGVKLIDFTPHSIAGGPESDIMEWGHRFFSTHIQAMVDKGATTQLEGDAMLADWLAHRNNPDALFFSPIVVDVAAKRVK
jgi:ubiquinone/menaquinone biosynthesis C-methylase UbiE